MKIPLRGGFEYDALTTARKFYKYLSRAKIAKKAKRQYNKRLRRKMKPDGVFDDT